MSPAPTCCVLAGGVGAARLLRGLVRAIPESNVTAIVNIADDFRIHGLHVSPDLDTVTYTLAGVDNAETGWGVTDETWAAMEMVRMYGGIEWFNLGDRDLGTNLFRTQRLSEGATLSEVTAEITNAWSIGARVLPVSDDAIQTRVTVVDEGEIGFQEYFVRRRHDVEVSSVRFEGIDEAHPSPGVIESIKSADLVVIAPSNPIVSIGPLLAVPGVSEALVERRKTVAAVSPIVGGRALKGPADRMMSELGHDATVVGIASIYEGVAATLVIDELDAELRSDVLGNTNDLSCVVTDTVMRDADTAQQLSRTIIDEVIG
ncbi:MAG: 2-phospho-L-lactate transferase [Acidimicrobiales bacterium]